MKQIQIKRSKLLPCLVAAMVLAAAEPLSSWAQQAAPAAEVEAKPKPKWERSVAAGLSLTKGNSDTILFTANAVGLRKWDKNELGLGAAAAHGENSGVVNNESYSAHIQYNRLISDRAYGMVRTEGLHDSIADVELRLTISPGFGYYLIKQEKRSLSFEVGPSFIYDRLGSGENSYLALRLGEKYEMAIGERARLWQSLEALPQVDDLNNFIAKLELGVEADLTKKLSLRVTLQDVYDNEPAPGREENDVRLVSGIAYKF